MRRAKHRRNRLGLRLRPAAPPHSDANRVLTFDGGAKLEQHGYELAHILLHTTPLPMSAQEDERHAELQTLWEAAGQKVATEYVTGRGWNQVPRFKLGRRGATIELTAAQHELLEKILQPAACQHLASHVKRDLIALRKAVVGATKVQRR